MAEGLRARKKRELRERLLSDAARLFAERGFDHVPVADIAAEADVSPATVFNYFPRKEDLVFQGMEEYSRQLVDGLRMRAPGVSFIQAFRELALAPRGLLAEDAPDAMERLLRVRGIIDGSVTLQARELLIADRMVSDLADVIAEVEPGTVRPRFLAASLVGLLQAMTREIHRRASGGATGPQIARAVLPEAEEALGVIERGLAAGLATALTTTSSASGTAGWRR